MALFRPGVAISEARGSVGGTTFSRNRSGMFLRTRVKPVDPGSQAQSVARERIAQLQQDWLSTLTAAERETFQVLAESNAGTNKLGDSIRLTAVNHFIQINALRLAGGLAILTTAPAPPAGAAAPTLTLVANTTDGIKCSAISPAMQAGDLCVIQISGAHNPTRNYYKGPWPTFITKVSTNATPWTLIANTDLAVGQRWFLRYRYLDLNGRLSPYVFQVFDVAA